MPFDSFFGSTMILMLSNLIVRSFGFIYRIYLSNLIGAEGMGLFQLIIPIYALVILTITSGVSISVSRMIAAEKAKKNFVNIRRITRYAMVIVSIVGLIAALLIYLKLDFIAVEILKDKRTYLSLLLLIPCIPIISASSALKGYFYGMSDMIPTAITQVFEQFIKIAVVILAASGFLQMGLEYACAVAIVGMAAGEIANLVLLFSIYLCKLLIANKKNKKFKMSLNEQTSMKMRKREIVKQLFYLSTPISVNRFITSLLGMVETILIPQRLFAGGLDYNFAVAELGRMAGMAMPLIFFPSLVTNSLATTLVPAIAQAQALKHYKTLNRRISNSIGTTTAMGFMVMVLFLSYSHKIGGFIYPNQEIGSILFALAFSCVFIYLQQIFLGVLNGLGKQGISLFNSTIGYLIRVLGVWFVVPNYGIYGYISVLTCSCVVVCGLDFLFVSKLTGIVFELSKWFLKPAIISGGLIPAGYTINFFLTKLGTMIGFSESSKVLDVIIVGIFSAFMIYIFTSFEILDIKALLPKFAGRSGKDRNGNA